MKTWIGLTFLLLSSFTSYTSYALNADVDQSFTEIQKIELININKADVDTLSLLKGIGEKRAKAIISYRELNGNFESVDDLLNIKGIGDKVLLLNKERIIL